MGINLQQYLDEIEAVEFVRENEILHRQFVLMKNRVNDTAYKIAVVGEFSSGKSTFINSIIGKDVLKHAKNETTAAVTYIHNVSMGDRKENTVRVNYRDGRSEVLNSLEEIQKYTTVQAGRNVAEEIMSVDIYVRFLHMDENIVIVDTPGLNGTARGHRAITIDEIQKSHACIYLLQLRGITHTDAEFLKVLLRYQKTYIFVQNFIDELKTAEGETLSDKLNEAREEVGKCFEGEEYRAYFTGISALWALAGRDESIRRLYEDSEEEIRPEEREGLLRESGYFDFIQILNQVVHDKEFEKMRQKDNCSAVIYFICEVLDVLISRQESMERMRREDRKNQDIDSMKKIKENILSSRDEMLKRLDNFVDSSFIEQKRTLFQHLKDLIDKIYAKMEQGINGVNRYQDFMEAVERRVFENFLNEKVVELNRILCEEKGICSNFVYKMTLARMDDYSGAAGNPKDLKFKHTDLENQTYEAQDDKKELAKMKKEREADAREVGVIEKWSAEKEREKSVIEGELRKKQVLLDQQRQYYQSELDSMRKNKPEVKQWKEEKSRKGLKGWFKDRIDGRRVIIHTDDSEVQKWEARKRQIEAEAYEEQENLNRQLEKLSEKRSRLEEEKDRLDADKKRLERKIERCSMEIRQKEEEIELLEEQAKREYLKRLKSQMLRDVDEYLNGRRGLSLRLRENIEEDMDKNAEQIKEMLRKEYDARIKARAAELDKSISGGEKELKQAYTDYSETIELFSKMKTILEEEAAS